MVIPEARSRLHSALRDLITGRITTWQFDKFYFELKCSSDRAVAEMATFGWGLYHDGVGPYRVTEHYVLKPQMREAAERALLFLETDLEYAWPKPPSQFWRDLAWSFAYNLLLPSGPALIIVALILLAVALGDGIGFIYSWACGVPGLLLLALCVWLWRWSNRTYSPAWQEYWASGDRDVWPFLNRAEYIKRAS